MGMVSGVLVLMGFAKVGFFIIFGPFFFGPLREKIGKRWKINGKPMENEGKEGGGAPGVPPSLFLRFPLVFHFFNFSIDFPTFPKFFSKWSNTNGLEPHSM